MGREKNVPECGRRSDKFDRDQRALLIHLRRAHDFGFDFNLRSGIFNRNFGAFADAFLENDHGPAGADGVRVARHYFAGYVNDHGHAHENALRAAALLRGGLARGRGPH